MIMRMLWMNKQKWLCWSTLRRTGDWVGDDWLELKWSKMGWMLCKIANVMKDKKVPAEGFDPSTSRLWDLRSNQLSYTGHVSVLFLPALSSSAAYRYWLSKIIETTSSSLLAISYHLLGHFVDFPQQTADVRMQHHFEFASQGLIDVVLLD